MKPNNRIEYRFGTLPRGVHFFCVPKRKEPKKKAPYVLACGSPGKIVASGKSKKLASLTNLSGTNLDAEGSRVVTGMAATNQAGESSPEKKPSFPRRRESSDCYPAWGNISTLGGVEV